MTDNNIKISNFIRSEIEEDLKSGLIKEVHTRFPPEPSGYLHIGHAKAIVTNFEIAKDYNGLCNLRFDDTNPLKEESEFEEAIKNDIKWLGYTWEDRLYYASDYFEKLYQYAIILIKKGLAYVCDLSAEEMREYRGTLSTPGKNSPNRNRSIEENLELFQQMREGKFKEGEKTLRAKIDMASPNINLRDPIMYRILYKNHHRTKDAWCIYPSYDFTHGQSDSMEGITYSLCDISFENHRPLYDWFCENLEIHHPKQREFARLNLSYTITQKRKLRELVEENFVNGWDDPRIPTFKGMRRRGYPAEAIRNFCTNIGLSKKVTTIDYAQFEYEVSEVIKQDAYHAMTVFDPLEVEITNLPDGEIIEREVKINPKNPELGLRKLYFSNKLYIEREDFKEEEDPKFFRLKLGQVVKLRNAFVIRCNEIVKDDDGKIIKLKCEYFPETLGGTKFEGKKVKGIIHFVSAAHAKNCEIRYFDKLFTKEDMNDIADDADFKEFLNKDSLKIYPNAKMEDNLPLNKTSYFQFIRKGYYYFDEDSNFDQEKYVFNFVVAK